MWAGRKRQLLSGPDQTDPEETDMATAAPIIPTASANVHSWLHRALAHFLPAQASAGAVNPLETTIVDLRLVLRRIEHARREQAHWDARFLAQTIGRAILAPLEDLVLAEELGRLRHGAVFALKPIAAIGALKTRSDVDVAGELDEAASLVRAAIAEAERLRARPS